MTGQRPNRILVIEDDRTLNRLLAEQLGRLGYEAQGVEGRAAALSVLAGFRPELAILDLRLPDADGLHFLPELREYCPVVILTAYGSIDQAVQAVRAGAADYLVKPVSAQSLELALKRFFDTAALKRDLAYWQALARSGQDAELPGASPQMAGVRRLVSLFAPADAPVLILGESGAGKLQVAHALHALSGRANGRFVAVDCDEGVTAADLFGDWRAEGAARDGLIAAADGGTVYLGGVDKLAPDLQARLLHAIDTATYRPAGSNALLPAQVRFLLASALSPEEIAPGGAIRNELLFRLAAFTIAVPPLRARPEDIPLLAEGFLAKRCFQRNTPKALSPEALAALCAHDWPGNTHELRTVIERSIILSAGQEAILPAHLGLPGRSARPGGGVTLAFDSPPTLDGLRDAYLRLLIETCGGNRRKIAEALGISERNTYRLLRKLEGGPEAEDGEPEDGEETPPARRGWLSPR